MSNYYQRNKERLSQYSNDYYHRNKERIKLRAKEYSRKYRTTHQLYIKQYQITHHKEENERRRRYDKEARVKVIEHYSNSKNCCVCCGEKELQFLTIDHINNDGDQHRKYGGHFYIWLVRRNFPEGFQVLCYNCNCSKGFYGRCPHQVEREKNIISI